jgi:pyridoxine kinase
MPMDAHENRRTILAISSQVVRGSVGLSVIVPTLQKLGRDVWPIPTIVLSNHPGHRHAAGVATPPERILAIVDALDQNGWLSDIDAIITGYLPSVAHVEAAAQIVQRVRDARKNSDTQAPREPLRYLCDPVLGDDPKGLYLAVDAATAIRDQLLPMADIATPNRFELSWLSGHPVQGEGDATIAARSLGVGCVVTTSVPGAPSARLNVETLLNVETWRTVSHSVSTERLPNVPHGTGDLFSAAFLAMSITQLEPIPPQPMRALQAATDLVARAIIASQGRDELRIPS